MPQNPQELAQLASQWANAVKADIRAQLTSFIERSGISEHEVALMFALSDTEISQIIRGNCECTITTLAKLLIITGNTLEIKPLEQSKLKSYEEVTPYVGAPQAVQPQFETVLDIPASLRNAPFGKDDKGRPLPPLEELFGGRRPSRQPSKAEIDRRLDEYWSRHTTQRPITPTTTSAPMPPMGAPMPPMGAPIPPMGAPTELPNGWKYDSQGKIRDAAGHFVSRARLEEAMRQMPPMGAPIPMPTPTPETSEPTTQYSSMTRDQLANLIADNLWDTEIDLGRASHHQLVQFLENKQRIMAQRSARKHEPQTQTDSPSSDDVERFIEAMGAFARSNPSVAKAMGNLFRGK